MKRLTLMVGLLLIASFALSPFLALAQEEELELEEYVAEDEAFTFSYPAGWVVDLSSEGGVYIANSEEALETLQTSEDVALEPGQFGMAYLFFPVDMITLLELDVAAEPEELLQSFVDFLMADGDEEDMPTFGEITLLEVDDETSIPAVPLAIENLDLEGLFMLYPVSEDVYALVTVGAYTGELADYEAEIMAIAGSLEVNFTAEELSELFADVDEGEGTEEPGD